MRAVLACLLSGSAVLCGGRCAWAQAGRFVLRPPTGGGAGSHFHIPIHLFGRDTDLVDVLGIIVLLILAALILIAVGYRLGWALGGGQKRSEAPARGGPAFGGTWAPLDASPPWFGTKVVSPVSGLDERDLILNPFEVAEKAIQTTRLMEFVAHHDPRLDPSALRKLVTDTFCRVQQCWEARDYGPVRSLLGPDILARHEELLRQMRQAHEINRIKGLLVKAVDFVHLFCPEAPDSQEVAALVTFEATGYFVDDRTGAHTRGSQTPRQFQEYWIFRRQGERWRLDDIKRTHESDLLWAANHVAGLSAEQLQNAQQSIAL